MVVTLTLTTEIDTRYTDPLMVIASPLDRQRYSVDTVVMNCWSQQYCRGKVAVSGHVATNLSHPVHISPDNINDHSI